MYGFLLTRRWLWFALFVVLLSAICVRAGMWQMDKHEDRRADNVIARTNLVAEPRPLDDVVPADQQVSGADEWTTVSMIGTYDPDRQVTVKFITRDGTPGVDVVTPLTLADGSAVLVNRGWMQTANNNERPTDVEAPPPGEVEVVGWVRPDSGARDRAVEPNDGQVRAISSLALQETGSTTLRSGYVNLQGQSGGTGELRLEPIPDLGQGSHFFYAFQWWFFALLAVIGYFWFAWSENRERRDGVRTPKRDAPADANAG